MISDDLSWFTYTHSIKKVVQWWLASKNGDFIMKNGGVQSSIVGMPPPAISTSDDLSTKTRDSKSPAKSVDVISIAISGS